ncbi:hypothetical protein QFZ67_000429 [Streptomyces sp. V1I1]|nr:hypothetical protein [Streptomyces sp. V1I1]
MGPDLAGQTWPACSSAVQQVSTIRRVTTYGSTLAPGGGRTAVVIAGGGRGSRRQTGTYSVGVAQPASGTRRRWGTAGPWPSAAAGSRRAVRTSRRRSDGDVEAAQAEQQGAGENDDDGAVAASVGTSGQRGRPGCSTASAASWLHPGFTAPVKFADGNPYGTSHVDAQGTNPVDDRHHPRRGPAPGRAHGEDRGAAQGTPDHPDTPPSTGPYVGVAVPGGAEAAGRPVLTGLLWLERWLQPCPVR